VFGEGEAQPGVGAGYEPDAGCHFLLMGGWWRAEDGTSPLPEPLFVQICPFLTTFENILCKTLQFYR
jgi:hypothetical protein